MIPGNFSIDWFSIWFVVDIIIHNYNSTSGTLTSPNFGASYPVEDVESRYFINVTESTASYDLLFTVDVMNINGGNGDYIKIGKGTKFDMTLYDFFQFKHPLFAMAERELGDL